MAKFEDCLKRLEEIVAELEKGDLQLDRAVQLFEEGMTLSQQCRSQLDEAEGKIEVLIKRGSRMQAQPFELGEPSSK